ncbi:copper export protein [Cenarchaeum symbiosum A]|uniref:Copper export protein n=1 Tax=Cenarchaeum symbiosum (strain A) TaxID=414004 RepID=A0RXV8_CENSY|nr:copper export protein [Cenarchaeum symbiosum A]
MRHAAMPLENAIITWIHLVSAAIWVGGGLFLGVVLAPVLKKTSMSLEERIRMMVIVGRRFNIVGIPSLIILMGTGLYTAYPILAGPRPLLDSSYGTFLFIKMALVVAVVVLLAVHVRIIRGDIERRILSGAMPENEVRSLRKKIIILGEVIAMVSVGILFFAALMDAGV